MAEKSNEMTFEQAIARLEEIVKNMESGTCALDKSLSLFEEGVKLVKFCNAELDNAEKRVKILQQSPNGEITEEDFLNIVKE